LPRSSLSCARDGGDANDGIAMYAPEFLQIERGSQILERHEQHHVADRVAMINQHIEIGRRAGHRSPQGRLPQLCAPAHRGHTDGGTQWNLQKGIHASSF
jgi:hypothetical protein